MTFEEKLAKLRKNAGYSQEDLADKLNVSRQTIYRWETGNALPDAMNLKQISALFNISLDVLLSDDDDLGTLPMATAPDEFNNEEDAQPLPSEKMKKAYGEVKITDKTIKNVDVEEDNLPMTNKVQRTLTIRKVLGWTLLGISIVAFIFIFVCIAGNSTVGLVVCIVLTILSLLISWLVTRFFGSDLLSSRYPFRKKAKKAEEYLTEKNYFFVRLQYDMLAYFFYDESTDSFGYYFLDNEQFVCPIQNYISLTCNGQGGGIEQTGTQLSGGIVVGAANGVAISRTPKYGNKSDTDFAFSLHYYDVNGEICEYAYKLTSFRVYPSYDPGNNQTTLRAQRETCSQSTREAYTKICGKLEGEKNKIV